jgi:hypothetical protein
LIKGGIELEMLVSLWDEGSSRDCHTRQMSRDLRMSIWTIADTQISLRLSNRTFIELVELDELVDPGKQLHSLVMKMLHI